MRGFMSSIGLAVASMFGMSSFPTISLAEPRPTRTSGKRYWFGGERYSPNGTRECTRRLRQIAAGRLTASNGVSAHG
jgi:hypothetical protein